MAGYQLKIAACVFLLEVLGLFCTGQQLHVKHAPSYIVFQSQSSTSPVSSSDLHNVLAGPLGLNSKQSSIMQSKSVLKRPKANVLFTVVTHKDQNLPVESMASFPVEWDVPSVDMELLMNKLQSKFVDKDPIMLDVMSNNQFFDIKTSSALFKSLPSSFDSLRDRLLDPNSVVSRLTPSAENSLNASRPSDWRLLAELQMFHDAIITMKKNAHTLNTKTPDLLSFTLTGLRGVGEEHGVDSKQAKDAHNAVTEFLNQMTEELKSLYNGNVMIEVLTVPYVDQAKSRKVRSLMETQSATSADPNKLNLELDWYGDFPAIFNIVLWLMIILLITIFFVAYGIWNLNPNLESILYRVPQDDLKKLN